MINVQTIRKYQNCEKVYEAIYNLHNKVSVSEIKKYLSEETKKENEKITKKANEIFGNSFLEDKNKYISLHNKKILSKKTIERCVTNDYRLEKDGNKWFISDKKRFGERYLDPRGSGIAIDIDPRDFGIAICDSILGSSPQVPLDKRSDGYYKKELHKFVLNVGSFITFAMIEAAKPFNDDTMTSRDREDLVFYWLNNFISFKDIFYYFRFKFDEIKRVHDWKTPMNEIREPIINQLIYAMEDLYPDIYLRYILAKRKITGKKNNSNHHR